MATVSVVIPSYNRGHCIRACLESVLKQTWQDFEIIVVDDASSDDTRAQVMAVPDKRIRYIAHDANRGGGAARNTGIQASTGEFVAFLDSDDSWTHDKLAKQIEGLHQKGPEYGLIYSWFIAFSPAGKELWKMHRTFNGRSTLELLEGNCIGTFSSIVIRRSILDAVGGMDEKMRSCQDWDLFVRINEVTSVCCIEEYLVYYLDNITDKYRISSNSQSVIHGHRRMLDKIQPQLNKAPVAAQAASLKHFANIFASAGSVGDAYRTAARVVKTSPTLSNIGWSIHVIARAIRHLAT